MNQSTLKKVSGWSMFGLGCAHQMVHVLFELNPEKPPIVSEMANFKIELMGTHSLLQFHSGFSLMTGFGLMFLGLVIAFLAKVSVPKKVDWLFVISMLVVFLTSLLYFHILAYGVTIIALVFYLLSLKKPAHG